MKKALFLTVVAAIIGGCSSSPQKEINEPVSIRYAEMESTKASLGQELSGYGKSAFDLTVFSSSCHLWKQNVEENESRMEVHCGDNELTIFTASDTYTVTYNYVNKDGVYYTRENNKLVESWSDRSRIKNQLESLDEFIDINTNYVYSLYSALTENKSIEDYMWQFEYETRIIPEMPINKKAAREIFEETIFDEDWFNTTFARVSLAKSDGLIPDQDELEARILTEIKPRLKYAFNGLSVEFCNPTGINFQACAVTATPLSKHIVFEDRYIKVRSFNQGTIENASYVIEIENKTDKVVEIKSADILLNNLRFKASIENKRIESHSKEHSKLRHKRGWTPMVTVEDKLAAIFYGIDVSYTIGTMNKEFHDHVYFNPLMMLNDE